MQITQNILTESEMLKYTNEGEKNGEMRETWLGITLEEVINEAEFWFKKELAEEIRKIAESPNNNEKIRKFFENLIILFVHEKRGERRSG